MKLLLNPIRSFWLLALLGILSVAWQASASGVSRYAFTYDGLTQLSIGYDDPSLPAIGYDAVVEHTADVTRNRTTGNRVLFAKFAEFVAAESGGIRLSQKGLDLVGNHLAQFGDDAANAGMMQNLQNAFSARQKVTGANANFYLHEASEATMMGRGLSYDAAHAAALGKYGVSPFNLYAPNVIQANPTLFNNAWRAAAGLPPLP